MIEEKQIKKAAESLPFREVGGAIFLWGGWWGCYYYTLSF